MTLTPEVLAMSREHRAVIDALTQEQIRELTGHWVRLWDQLGPEFAEALDDLTASAAENGGRITRSQALKHRKLKDALTLAKARIEQLGEQVADTVTGELDQAVKLGAFHQSELIAAQLPPGSAALTTGFDRVPLEALDAITLRATERIQSLSIPLTDNMVAQMKRELIRGIAVGEHPRRVAKRILDATEKKFNGGLSRALTIARTEMLDALRAGSQTADKANRDILAGWIWSANLNGRTCQACLGMHGTEHDIDEPGPEGHQNCRCDRLPKTKSWAELGLPGVEDTISPIQSAEDYFTNLTPDSQRLLIGGPSHDAWLAGKFPMDQWAVKKKNPGWRDSWVPARPPAA